MTLTIRRQRQWKLLLIVILLKTMGCGRKPLTLESVQTPAIESRLPTGSTPTSSAPSPPPQVKIPLGEPPAPPPLTPPPVAPPVVAPPPVLPPVASPPPIPPPVVPPPVITLELKDQYQYLASSVGLSLTEKDTACRQLGSGWALTKLDVPSEIFKVREFLSKYATPIAGDPLFAIPVIANLCKDVQSWTLPGIDFGADCSGQYLMLAWPGFREKGDSGCKSNPCAFEDTSDPRKWPALCERMAPI